MRFPKPNLNALVWPAAGLAVLLTVGCLYSPSGVNKSTDLYPAPDENGVVTIKYTPAVGSEPSEQVRFQLVPEEEDGTALEKVDDGTGPEYTATFAVGDLTGIQFVDVFHDESEELAAKLAFLASVPEATAEEDASGEGEGEATDEEE